VLYVNKIEERGERAANKQDCEEGEEYGVGLRIEFCTRRQVTELSV